MMSSLNDHTIIKTIENKHVVNDNVIKDTKQVNCKSSADYCLFYSTCNEIEKGKDDRPVRTCPKRSLTSFFFYIVLTVCMTTVQTRVVSRLCKVSH